MVAFNVEGDESAVCINNYLHNGQLTISGPCESCGEKPRKGERFNRHCPEPDSIDAYLAIASGEPSHLTKESFVCMPCYRHFRVILGNIQTSKVTLSHTHKSNNEIMSFVFGSDSETDEVNP